MPRLLRPGGGLTSASARLRTPYGTASISWTLADAVLTVEASVPPNATAEVSLPDGTWTEVGSGSHRWQVPHTSADIRPQPLTVDSTFGAVIDTPGAMQIIIDAIVRRIPEAGPMVEGGMAAVDPKTTIRDGLAVMPGADSLYIELDAAFSSSDRS